MSVNLFAFLQKDARTVQVSLQGYEKSHTYLTTDESAQVGSYVVVPYQPKDGPERLSVGIIKAVDSYVNIRVDDHKRYQWVIDRISLADETVRVERETAITAMIDEALRRKAVSDLIYRTAEGMSPEDRTTFHALIGD